LSSGNYGNLYEAYFRVMGVLAEDLMAMFALALDLPEDFFADKIDPPQSAGYGVSQLPPPPERAPLPGQLRCRRALGLRLV